MLNGNLRYPPYKQVQDVDSFLRTGNVIVSGAEVKRRTAAVMEDEGFPIPVDLMEDFIVISFQDAISNRVTYGPKESLAAIAVIEKIHPDTKWIGRTTWVTDYVDLLLGKAIDLNPFGIWDVFFRNGDLYIINQGNYAHMLYHLLKSENKLPELDEVINHGLFNNPDEHEFASCEIDEAVVDIMVHGRISTALTSEGIDDGNYIDVNTNAVVKHISNITGRVREKISHTTVISAEEFKQGLVYEAVR